MEGLESTRENEIIFGKVIKGRNLFTPYSLAYYRPNSIFLDDSPLELVFPSNNSYKGSSTKEGSNSKAIAKRRKRNKNKKTHRNAKR